MNTKTDLETRIKNALEMAEWGAIDGAHHKMWVIDQMIRALTGGKMYQTEVLDSPEYNQWVKDFEFGEDGPLTYVWDTGVAP